MENMQNVRAALDALGVKTCLACGKTGAKSLCKGCRSVSFCGKACQTEAWRGHKKACRRVQRERPGSTRARRGRVRRTRPPAPRSWSETQALIVELD